MQMNPELARQHAHVVAVRARIASRVKRDRAPEPAVHYASPHYDHVRVWRRVERARRPKGPRVEDVVDAACDAWGWTRADVLDRTTSPKRARRRLVVSYLCRELVRGASLPDVSVRLCRDHASVLHAHRVVTRLRAEGDAGVEAKIVEVLSYLGLA